jgi:hypothetical protein
VHCTAQWLVEQRHIWVHLLMCCDPSPEGRAFSCSKVPAHHHKAQAALAKLQAQPVS